MKSYILFGGRNFWVTMSIPKKGTVVPRMTKDITLQMTKKCIPMEGKRVTGIAKGIPKRGTGVDEMTKGNAKKEISGTDISKGIPKRRLMFMG